MASSDPSSSAATLGECVVCGKETAIGCSVCKKAGLDWMYYCSVDHQRPIWKSHKQVCGKNPFEWPPLTDEEVEEAWESRNSSKSGMDKSPTWKEYMVRLGAVLPPVSEVLAKDGTDAAFRVLLEILQVPKPNVALQRLIQHNRATSAAVKTMKAIPSLRTKATRKEYARVLSQETLGNMAICQFAFERSLPDDWKWTSDFEHRLLIYTSVVAAGCTRILENGEKMELIDYPPIRHSFEVLTLMEYCNVVLSQLPSGRCVVWSTTN
ncbi:zinc finger MYND domain-containing protein [Sporobolomyces salmoneus]|uniref:zinc finger MYND domain-containing protein n=1 Tax=Sporobolomyces salmoneus TaxID=183962 RepID=UPI00317C7ED0